MSTMISITKKEFGTFFSSQAAYLFLGVFLAANLFIFFWLESFFARNIADLQPLFQWMPVLLIFLCSAITMRMWAEERRIGTEELLLTSPISYLTIIGGKFLACLALVAIALLLSFPLAVTVSFLGPLDWGPVFGGYLAALFLAGAYISIGLFVSSRSDNQLVALISSVVVCAVFYFIGSPAITGFFNNNTSEFLQLLGSGSRFDSITRGVIDIRDLTYYLSIAGIFLVLTIYSLEQQRWAGNNTRSAHRRWMAFAIILAANLLAVNIWLAPIQQVRMDLTENHLYSLSDTTRNYLGRLREPLLIRGYFSAQTHPLLAPLVPSLCDLLKEYQVAGNGKVKVEIVDPGENPELEQEAAEKYGIRPVPFRSSSRYQTAITNSYFNILVSYGNEFQTLGFRDLIDIKSQAEDDLNVALKNPEYDISQAIKKVLYSYQSSGNLFDTITVPVSFTGYISGDSTLPQELVKLKGAIREALLKMDNKSQGRFSHSFIDPEKKGKEFIQKLQQNWGFQPMIAGLLSTKSFWFYMVMSNGSQSIQVPMPSDLSEAGINRSLQSALKRFSTGFLKTIALVEPPSEPPMPQYGMPGKGPHFRQLRTVLSEDHSVIDADLKDGQVPENADILLIVSPEEMNTKQLFAIDQFLMRGGTVITTTSPFDLNLRGGLSVQEKNSGLEKWLKFQGLSLEKQLVLDPHNAPFPVPVRRNLGGIEIQETKLVNYPFFVDIRQDGMNQDSGMLNGINQLTFDWGSPLHIDNEKSGGRRVVKLLQSSKDSWRSSDLNIQPNFQQYGNLGFKVGEDTGAATLAVMVEGNFSSYFKDKPFPLNEETDKVSETAEKKDQGEKNEDAAKPPVINRLIDHSPDSSRLIVLASNTFLTDVSLDLSTSVSGTQYLTPVQLVANCIDWSLEDRSFLTMRNQTRFSRTLLPLQNSERQLIEYLNYALAVIGLVLVWGAGVFIRRRSRVRFQAILDSGRMV